MICRQVRNINKRARYILLARHSGGRGLWASALSNLFPNTVLILKTGKYHGQPKHRKPSKRVADGKKLRLEVAWGFRQQRVVPTM